MYGTFLLILAYLIWGFFPLYFRQMESISSYDILIFRTLFTLVCVLPLVFLLGKKEEFFRQFRSPRSLAMLLLSGILVSLNWLIFIILVNSGHTLQASLGYYINPLLTVLLSMIFFRERFGKLQWTSLAIASLGVTVFAVGAGTLPWGGLAAALTFGLYGLMKKISPTDSLTSLTMETLLLMPVVAWYLWYFEAIPAVWKTDPRLFFWLFGCGVLTALTLLLYGAGALRCKLSTMGFCQYITPTMQFLTAVIIFKEPMPTAQWICFGLIWGSLILFTIDSLRDEKSKSTYIP